MVDRWVDRAWGMVIGYKEKLKSVHCPVVFHGGKIDNVIITNPTSV